MVTSHHNNKYCALTKIAKPSIVISLTLTESFLLKIFFEDLVLGSFFCNYLIKEKYNQEYENIACIFSSSFCFNFIRA